MKKLILKYIIIILFIPICLSGEFQIKNSPLSDKVKTNKQLNIKLRNKSEKEKQYSQIFFEDFEDGAPDWTAIDETDVGDYWHTDSFNAFGGEGKSWWMGDVTVGENGGYLDNWYQVLDTPPVTLPSNGNMTLSFEHFRAIESPGVYENFDGWDGFNVRIRRATQEYDEAAVLTNTTPSYNCSSLYSFGFIHGEDSTGIPGIPGWGGSTDWTNTTITIPNSYHGEEVIISFSFASDGAECTSEHDNWTGIFVDNINIAGVFYNDGEDESGFHAFTHTPIGGQLWHIYQDNDAPSPTHALGCFNDTTGTYQPNMENYFISPEIELPPNVDIIWDMYIESELDDSSEFPDCDYIYVQVRHRDDEKWSPWYSVSNPTGGQPQYVFTGTLEEWGEFSQFWSGYNDISTLAGDTIQFRIGLHSNSDIPTTSGLKVDNFEVKSYLDLNPPRDLYSVYDIENRQIELNWSSPLDGKIEELEYNQGNWVSYISDSQPYAMKITNPYDYDVPLVDINFMLYNYDTEIDTINGTVDVFIWENENGLPGSILAEIDNINNIPNQEYKSVEVYDYNIIIPAYESIFVGINNFEVEDQGILAEDVNEQNHSYCFAYGNWYNISEVYDELTNISITASILVDDPLVGEPNSYNVYKSLVSGEFNDVYSNTVDTFFIDTTFEPGNEYFYTLTAVYDEGESKFANEKSVFAEIESAEEFYYDNGIAESGYSTGESLNKLAVKITPDKYPLRIIRLNYYIYSNNGVLILQLWNNDGKDGLPGSELLEHPIKIQSDNVKEGDWNIITIPEDYNIIINSGEFYIGWVEVTNNSLIGIDNGASPQNRGYQYTAGEWFDYSQGVPQNIMMRVIVDTLPQIKADFSSDKVTGTLPVNVQFFDKSSPVINPIVEWKWDFGDGDSSNIQDPIHTYEEEGNYTVNLIVTDSEDSTALITKDDYISVYSPLWPGDTDKNGIVDTLDVIPIGIYYGSNGYPRDNISFAWQAYEYPGNWSEPAAAYADCNGDGIVDIVDILGIGFNWNKTHATYSVNSIIPQNLEIYRDNFHDIYHNLGDNNCENEIKNYIAKLFDFPLIIPENKIKLSNCYPNPCKNYTNIKYNTSDQNRCGRIKIYNIKGELIKNMTISPDKSQVVWDIRDENNKKVSNGIYFYSLEVDGKIVETKKLLLMR